MLANTVEDPNHDPNLYSEIDVSTCTSSTNVEDDGTDEIFVENFEAMNASSCMTSWGEMSEGKCLGPVQMSATNSGMYF